MTRIIFSTLKSVVIIFPILIGAFLAVWGTAKLSEANLVPVEKWSAPHGLLVFSSEKLSQAAYVHVGVTVNPSDVEGNVVPTEVELRFGWDWTHPEYVIPEEVTVGVQFPYVVVNYRDFEISRADDEQPIPSIDKRVIVTEEQGVSSSVFYIRFNPLHVHDWQHYALRIGFDWKEALRRESFSVFTISLPILLGLDPEGLDYPYEQCPDVHYAYYGDNLELTVGMSFPWDFEIKQSFPPTGFVMTEVGGDAQNIFWEPQLYASGKRVSGKSLQMIMVEFEVTRLSEVRDRLLFDSGLYMGLGISLIFSGIHEALREGAELKRDQTPRR